MRYFKSLYIIYWKQYDGLIYNKTSNLLKFSQMQNT